MKIQFKGKQIFIITFVAIVLIGAWLANEKWKFISLPGQKAPALNNNISSELKGLKENTVVFFTPKDSFVLPAGYKMDSQAIEKSVLIYPKEQSGIKYSGIESLESFKGILITSANTVKNAEEFKSQVQKKFDSFRSANPKTDAKGGFLKDSQEMDKFVITQSKPFKMIETLLNREMIIEIVGHEDSEAYKTVVDSYNASEQISTADRTAAFKLQKELVTAYEDKDTSKLFSILSTDAQKKNSLSKIDGSVKQELFKGFISNQPTALYVFNGNFIMQSKVLFDKGVMRRLDISFKVDYDGQKNNWSIDSFVIKDKEPYLSMVGIE